MNTQPEVNCSKTSHQKATPKIFTMTPYPGVTIMCVSDRKREDEMEKWSHLLRAVVVHMFAGDVLSIAYLSASNQDRAVKPFHRASLHNMMAKKPITVPACTHTYTHTGDNLHSVKHIDLYRGDIWTPRLFEQIWCQ